MNHPLTARAARVTACVVLTLLSLFSSQAFGQACPEGNVLSGIKPSSSRATYTQRMSDGVASKEGDPWKSNLTGVLSSDKSYVVYDLKQTTAIKAALIQADNNDKYTLEISDDGQAWRPLWDAPTAGEAGLRMRSSNQLSGEGRYVRLKASGGDKYYSVAELQIFCSVPATWPPKITRKTGKEIDPGKARLRRLAKWKAAVGILGGLLILLSFSTRRDEDGRALPRWVEGAAGLTLLVAMILFSAFASPEQLPDPKAEMLWPLAVASWIGVVMLGGALLLRSQLSPWLEIVASAATGVALWMAYHDPAFDADAALPWPLIAGILGFIALALIAVFGKGAISHPSFNKVQRPMLMGAITIMAALSWTNFWTFHGWRAVHMHDTFHYYMGAKYFPENRYTKLYHCAAIAELEDAREAQVKKRKIRNLVDNVLGPGTLVMDHPEICREAFTSNDRWELFKADLRYFRGNMGSKYWDKIFGDHGYNASPVWTTMGKAVADWASAPIPPELLALSKKLAAEGKLSSAEKREFQKLTRERNKEMDKMIQRVALIDGFLYAGVFLLFGWAFGWRIMAIAALCWGAGYPWAYFWTGGAFMRIPWLITAVAGLCLLKKEKYFWGGFFLMWTLLLRAFPGALIVGLAVKILIDLVRGRDAAEIAAEQQSPGWLSRVVKPLGPVKTLIDRIRPRHQRIIVGTFAAIAVLVTLSLPANDGIGSYKEFWANSQKHVQTPLTNHMGLPTLVAYHPDKVGRIIRQGKLQDPWEVWKKERKATRKARAPLYWGMIGGFLVLLGLISQRYKEDWVITAASAIMILGLFELTSYYYVFMVLFAPLVGRSSFRLVAYLSTAVIGQILYLNIGWYDEQYTAETLLMLVGVLAMLIDLLWPRKPGEITDLLEEDEDGAIAAPAPAPVPAPADEEIVPA